MRIGKNINKNMLIMEKLVNNSKKFYYNKNFRTY